MLSLVVQVVADVVVGGGGEVVVGGEL